MNGSSTSTSITEYLKNTKLVVKNKSGIMLLPYSDIIYLEADSNYTLIHTIKGPIWVCKTLKAVMLRLPEQLFIRTHSKYCVNLSKVKLIHNKFNKIVMEDDSIAYVSRAKKIEVFQYFKDSIL